MSLAEDISHMLVQPVHFISHGVAELFNFLLNEERCGSSFIRYPYFRAKLHGLLSGIASRHCDKRVSTTDAETRTAVANSANAVTVHVWVLSHHIFSSNRLSDVWMKMPCEQPKTLSKQ